MLKIFLRDQRGATAIEYCLIAALIGVAMLGALGTLKGKMETLLRTAGSSIGG